MHFIFGSQLFLNVNMDGKRFINESVPYDIVLYSLQNEKNGVCCIIWDVYYRKMEKRVKDCMQQAVQLADSSATIVIRVLFGFALYNDMRKSDQTCSAYH